MDSYYITLCSDRTNPVHTSFRFLEFALCVVVSVARERHVVLTNKRRFADRKKMTTFSHLSVLKYGINASGPCM